MTVAAVTFASIECEVRDRVAYVTFATPESLNSITESRLDDLQALGDALTADTSLQAVCISGAGRAFCVGLDLELLKRAFDDLEYFETVIRRLNQFLICLESLPIPTVAMVNGIARAGGFEIALACDLMLIADEARIGDNHTHVGVMPGGGSTQRLPRRIGMQKALELILTARWLDGIEAAACGLALRSVPQSRLVEETERLLDQFRNKPRAVLSVAKATIRASDELTVQQGIALEIDQFIRYTRDDDTARAGFLRSLADARRAVRC